MDPAAKKVALRSITYGLYVLTAIDGEDAAAAGVNWLTQTSFDPPLIVAAVKADSGAADIIGRTGTFAVNTLRHDQLDIAKATFRSTTLEDGKLNGLAFEPGEATGAPVLLDTPYWFEARVTDTVTGGDHTIFVAEVVGAGVREEGAAPLVLRDTGMNYGG